MKYKPTPLLLVSVCLLVYGTYIFIFPTSVPIGWGVYLAVICFVSSAFLFVIYRIIGHHYKDKVWSQVGLELVILMIIITYFFSKNISKLF